MERGRRAAHRRPADRQRITDRAKPARTRAECAPGPSPADRAFGEHRARPLRRPVSGLAACQAAAFPPGGRAVASWAAWARARGSASRGRRTVAGTAQAGRRSASCFPFNCMRGMRMRAPNAAHTIAQRIGANACGVGAYPSSVFATLGEHVAEQMKAMPRSRKARRRTVARCFK
ncbi:hypothetical protein C7S13_2925 [Burkholderia cepacia]|nr:hypothetical protein [Burkholderia cepacia]